MSRRAWLLSTMGWDGGLPVLVAFSPELLDLVMPDRDLTELTAVLVVPIVAALIRTHQGRRQMERRFGRAPLGRQFLFGCAIVVLLVFEFLTGAAHCARGRGFPLWGWVIPVAIYLAYLGLVVVALRPRRLVDG